MLLWALAVVGMLWADVDWSERFGGLRGYHKLLLIPLLLAQFRRSERARWVILGFFISAFALLVLSWLTPYPGSWGRENADIGVPVKDYILQSGIFAICALGLLAQAVEWRARRPQLALAAVIVAAFFIANNIYVATSRTTLVIIVGLLLLFGFRQFGWKGMLAVGILGGTLASLFWVSSPYLRDRVTQVIEEVRDYPRATPKRLLDCVSNFGRSRSNLSRQRRWSVTEPEQSRHYSGEALRATLAWLQWSRAIRTIRFSPWRSNSASLAPLRLSPCGSFT